MTTTIAVAQAPSIPGAIDENVTQATVLIQQAAESGANIVVLPELFLSGYDIAGIEADPQRHLVAPTDPPVGRLRHVCADRRVATIVGAAVDLGADAVNAALVISADGELLDVYAKVHLWGHERGPFVAGSHLTVAQLAGCQVGIAICFDAGFPEHVRALAVAGAEVIAAPSAFAVGEERLRYERYFPLRALENTVYVAASNAVGLQGGAEMFGDSLLIGPRGEEIGRVQDPIGVAVGAVDSGHLDTARRELPYLSELAATAPDLPVCHLTGGR